MEKQQQEMEVRMQQEMEKLGVMAPQMQFGGAQMPGMSMQMPGTSMQVPAMSMQMPGAPSFPQQDQGQMYVYGPNGELIPK